MAYTITSWDGHTLNGASGLEADFAHDAPWQRGVTINETRRRNFQSGVDSLNREPWQFDILVSRSGTTLTYAQAQANIQQWFNPWKTSTRQLAGLADDGSTAVYLDCYVIGYQKIVDNGGGAMWRVTLRSVVPWFQKTTLDSPTTSPVSNGGTTRIYPQLTFSGGGATASYAVFSVTDNSGRGLVGYPVQMSRTSLTANTYFVFVNGVSVPTLKNGTGTAWARVDCVPGGTTLVVVFYGSTLPTNPLQDTLVLGSLAATSNNATHTHNAFAISTYPQANATWQPTIFTITSGGPSSSGFEMVDSSSSVAFTMHNPASGNRNDANAMVMQLGSQTGTANAIAAGLSRVTALHSAGVRSFVRGRVAGSVSWFDAWTQTGNATVTTTIDIDNAVEIVAGIEYTTTSGTDGASLTLSGSHAITLASAPTVALATSGTVRIYDGTFSNTTTGQTLTFTTYCFPDGTLTWDFNADPNQRGLTNSNTATACVIGSALPTSDPVEGFALDPGNNTISTTLAGPPTWTILKRDGYA